MHNQLDESTRVWGMACHISALAGFAIPFGSIAGPLIVWLIQKDKHPFINEQGKESVNFQISMVIYLLLLALIALIIMGILLPILSLTTSSVVYTISLITLFQLVFVLTIIFQLVMIIVAAIKAYNGESYRYPFNFRFFK